MKTITVDIKQKEINDLLEQLNQEEISTSSFYDEMKSFTKEELIGYLDFVYKKKFDTIELYNYTFDDLVDKIIILYTLKN